MTEDRPRSISKKLSANDIGANGSHQAGILVPKDREILSFFPDLGCSEKNPRVVIEFIDANGEFWNFTFIYYNNKFFDEHGTRNEYRLTGMTRYLKSIKAAVGDSIVLTRDDNCRYSISLKRESEQPTAAEQFDACAFETSVVINLSVSSSWKVVQI